jgi:hypothetical protein
MTQRYARFSRMAFSGTSPRGMRVPRLFPVALSVLLTAPPAFARDAGDEPATAPTGTTTPDTTAPGTAVPADLQAAVTRAEFLGRQLHLHDRAAWLATDAMLADKRAQPLLPKMGGWLTEPSAHGIRVVFHSNEPAPRRLYEIDVDEAERLSEPTLESPEPMSADLIAQRKARDLAQSQSFMRCARKYNIVVLPSAEGLRVYLMPGFEKTGVYPLGGYHLFETDKTGERVVASRRFTNGCIDMDETAVPKQPREDGFRPVGMMFTHLLDPQPTEVHVFVSLYARQPMLIATVDNRRMWTVERGRISLRDTASNEASAP